jgi:thymidylate synthase ThyX
MSYSAHVLADSTSPHGPRLTTIEVTLPHSVAAELLSYRAFSRTVPPSRPVALKTLIEAVRKDPANPTLTGLSPKSQLLAKVEWKKAAEVAIERAEHLSGGDIGLPADLVARLLEPFSWLTFIITSTEWANFFAQRCRPHGQPEIQHTAELMRAAYAASKPEKVAMKEWHLPYIDESERTLPIEKLRMASIVRCSRVSAMTEDGQRDAEADLALYDKLIGDGDAGGNWSPFEHVATPADDVKFYGNVRGWRQFRKNFPRENISEYRAELPDGSILAIGKVADPKKREVSVFDKGR